MTISVSHARLFYKPFARPVAVVLAFIFAEEAIGLSVPWVLGTLIKLLAAGGELLPILLLAIAVAAAYPALNLLGHKKWRYNYLGVSQPLKRHVLRVTKQRLMGLSLAQHLDRHSGLKMTTISEGQKAIEMLLRTMVNEIVPMAAGVGVVAVLLVFRQPILAGILVTGGALFVLRSVVLNRMVRGPVEKLTREQHIENKFRTDVMRNMELVQLSAQEERAVRESMESYERIHAMDAAIWLPHSYRSVWRDQFLIATQISVLATCIWLVRTDQADVGNVFTWLTWTAIVTSRIHRISWLMREIITELSAATIFLELLDMEPDVVDPPDAVRPERFHGRIEFHDVWLSYSRRTKEEPGDAPFPMDSRDSLRGVSLTIEPGQRVAIVGPSGAGKSTLIYALMRGQNPSRGHITVDGHDLRELHGRNWRSHVGIVPQDVFVFDKPLGYNMCWNLGSEGTPEERERLERVTDMACLRDLVDGLEYGFDTIIGERGIKLSGGQRQRVGIARAIMGEPDVLIFDEATSSLDAVNERLIHQSIRTAGQGRTTIIVAHRLSTVRDADRIFVMDAGRIVGQGTHETLMGSCPTYRELVEHQMAVF